VKFQVSTLDKSDHLLKPFLQKR